MAYEIEKMSVEEILAHKANKTLIYNYHSDEEYEEAKILCGRPNGIINFNESPHDWAYKLYRKMQSRDWVSGQVTLTGDAVQYTKIPSEIRETYDLVLAQLITNDSIQTSQLMIGISSYITSPAVSAVLSRQAYEESNHAESYTRMAEDVCKNTKRIYNLWKTDEELGLKNQSVADMYTRIYKGDDVTVKDILMAFVANQILEELVFPGGFLAIYKLEEFGMYGSSQMIAEINDLGLPVEQSAA